MSDTKADQTRQTESEQEHDYDDAESAVFYAVYHAETPLTFVEIAERPETDSFDETEIGEAIEERNFGTKEYGNVTAYYTTPETTVTVDITREMYEEMMDKGSYIGEDPYGVEVHLREDFASIGPKHPDESPSPDTWGPVFPVSDPSEPDRDENVADASSRKALLETEHGDTIAVTEVHSGARRIPEQLEVAQRTNTYFGPKIDLKADEEFEGDVHGWTLICPDWKSHAVLWKAVTDHDNFVQDRIRYATVSVDLRDVTQYDICESCGEPIRDPFHRSMAIIGACSGGFEEGSDDGA